MLDKAYDPQGTEDRIYKMWEESGAFIADNTSDKETFTISMPPPNATGQLHLGHSVMLALEDIFIRYARMQGKEALWLPGTDHAAIATENVVIKKLQKEGIKDPREELGREKLVDAIKEFVDGSQDTIRGQIRKMGSSCDWSRERYTMDDALNRCVNEVFCKMFADDLIYRGHRIVNWDPKLQTNVSDDEVDHENRTDPFYTFQYGPFQIGTVRPETKFGDKYVVMHPDDERYKQYKHGDTFECEWINGPITAMIIKDEAVDPEFGTGVMTITPWHTAIDFEIAERHGLDKEQVIDFEGKLLPIAGEFAGMKIGDAREKIVEKLDKKGLLIKIDEKYEHTVAVNSRGGGMIEPQIKLQWFINVNKRVKSWKGRWAGKEMSIKEVMQDAVSRDDEEGDKIDISPDRFAKTYFYWIDNLRDWCISRQIWWGHRIPVWYKGSEVFAGVLPPEGEGWEQDPDTLDTWFSSALWTWSTLVDTKCAADYSLTLHEMLDNSPDYRKFHPTQIMETGYDILPFWVARMILMTTYVIGDYPFETVYLHGLIRTRDGSKMSKSKPETMIDPLSVIQTYGTDALRMSMIVGQSPGNDQKLYEEKIAGYRNFINKLWNASRFVLMQCETAGVTPAEVESGKWNVDDLSLADRALLSALQELIDDVTQGLDTYRLSDTGEKLYSFVWDYFCDWYLELSKGDANPAVLIHTLRTVLQLLHPYCPFVTEELWAQFKHEKYPMLIKHCWPNSIPITENDKKDRAWFSLLIESISQIRSLRSEADNFLVDALNASDMAHIYIIKDHCSQFFIEHSKTIERMTNSAIEIMDEHPDKSDIEYAGREGHQQRQTSCISSVLSNGTEIVLDIGDSYNAGAAINKLNAEKKRIEGFINASNAKFNNEKFMQNAKEEIIAREQEKLLSNQVKLEKIVERLESLL